MAVSFKRTFDLARMAGDAWKLRRASDPKVADRARQALACRMGRLRGLPQKIGQILSMNAAHSTTPFQMLTDQVEPLPFSTIRDSLVEAWERPISYVVSRIHDPGIAASLGQVHRATLLNGKEVAIKVRFPGIQHAVTNDLNLLGWLAFPAKEKEKGFDRTAYIEELLRDLAEELDYEMEADHQEEFGRAANKIKGLLVPKVFREHSNNSVLVTSWEEGETIDEVMASWSSDQKECLARQIFQAFALLLFDEGLVHADPHAGNYRFRRGEKIHQVIMYDFGSVLHLSTSERLALISLLRATMDRRAVDPLPYFVAMGFNPALLRPIREKLPALCSVLFEPFVTDAPYDWTRWNRGDRVAGILGDDRWNFRMSGPARLMFLMRALHGLVYYMEKLGQPINGAKLLRPIIDKHSADAEKIVLPIEPDPAVNFKGLARTLRIEIRDQEGVRALVKLPAMAVEDLETYLDPEVMVKIERRGIDLSEIIDRVRRNGYSPGEVFDLQVDAKRFSLNLE